MMTLLISFLIFSGCNSQPEEKTTEFKDTAMAMEYKVIVGKPLRSLERNKVKKIIRDSFVEINTIYNKWNQNSEVSRINHLKAGETMPISPKLENLLKQVDEIVKISNGRFDPTVEPLQQLWKEKLDLGGIPNQDEIDEITQAVGWNNIHVENSRCWKDHDQTSLDLGGIAKGLGVDLIVERLNKAGHPDVFVEWGGEIRASGQHPDQRPWKIFISRFSDPNPESAIAHFELNNQAIATSGDYLQNWTIIKDRECVTYCHIFDPHHHTPLVAKHDTVASVSVVAPKCALADALATTAMTFSTSQEAKEWAETVQEKDSSISFWIVTREHN